MPHRGVVAVTPVEVEWDVRAHGAPTIAIAAIIMGRLLQEYALFNYQCKDLVSISQIIFISVPGYNQNNLIIEFK